MISWLKGQIIHKWNYSSKKGVVIVCAGVGYEVQLLTGHLNAIDNSNDQEIWIHQIERDDCTNLYGFQEIKQRDLFRKLINVNGIGAQIGMALLDDFSVMDLVLAIESENIKVLTQSQGVGKRIAERLTMELRNKLNDFQTEENNIYNNKTRNHNDSFSDSIDEITSILNSLGYVDEEITRALESIENDGKDLISLDNQTSSETKTDLFDKQLTEILKRVSQNDHLMEGKGLN